MRPKSRIKIGISEQKTPDMVAVARLAGQAEELTALENDAVIALMLFMGEAAAGILGHGPVDARLDRPIVVAPRPLDLGREPRRDSRQLRSASGRARGGQYV